MAGQPDDDVETYFPGIFSTAKGGLFGGFFNGAALADANIAAVIMDFRWTTSFQGTTAATTIKYAFPHLTSDYNITPSPNTVDPVSHVPVTDIQKAAIVTSLGLIASYANVVFQEAASGSAADATLRFAQTATGGSAARFPTNDGPYAKSDSRDAGDNFEGVNGNPPSAQYFGTDQFNTIMHELGHSIGLKHGHDPGLHGALRADVNDNEFSVMTYASWLGSPGIDRTPTEARLGSSPQSYMMYDIAALQELYGGANFSKAGTVATYSWDAITGQESINGAAAPLTGVTVTAKIFSTVWTGGSASIYDLHNFAQDQVDDLRPGHWLRFSDGQLADLNSQANAGDPSYLAKGNIYNALLYHGDLRSEISTLITGSGNDTLVGNDRDDHMSAGAGNDVLIAGSGNDTMSGGPGADTFYFGSGYSVVRDTVADLNGDVIHNFGFGGVDVLGARIGWESIAIGSTTVTISTGGSTVLIDGNFASGGEFVITNRGVGTDAHTAINFVNYLPSLSEGVSVNPALIRGIANQPMLTGDGAIGFTAELKSAESFFKNSVGFYKVASDGTILDAHLLFANSLGVPQEARTFDLGTPGNNQRIGFFLIQDGFDQYGNVPTDLSFRAPSGGPANIDSGAAVLMSASLGVLGKTPVFHSFAALNPNGLNEVLSGITPGNHELLIGFEDLPRATGDNDFNDVVLGVWTHQVANQII
jgi:Ca2+-binding RTX toxin-like protein